MGHVKFMAFSFLFGLAAFALAQDEGKLQSGPKVGASIPAALPTFNVNGPAKGRASCMICRFALYPAVLVFAKEPAEGKDGALNDLLKKLDDAAADFEDRAFSAGVVFISPDARDSSTNPDEKDAKKLIDEAVAREKLHERLAKRAEKWKHVIVACHPPETPKSFMLNPKADVTVVFYERLKVVDNWAFGPDALQAKDVDAVEKKLRETLPLTKKKG